MARHEQHREDLMREAVALVQRAEYSVLEQSDLLVIGFHKNGAPSFYWGEDPVVHFNTQYEIRRLYWQGLLYKAEKRQLVSLQRHRTQQASELLSVTLDPPEKEAKLNLIQSMLQNIHSKLLSGKMQLVRQIPIDHNFTQQLLDWLQLVPQTLQCAERPNV
jgi:hypothetical protein